MDMEDGFNALMLKAWTSAMLIKHGDGVKGLRDIAATMTAYMCMLLDGTSNIEEMRSHLIAEVLDLLKEMSGIKVGYGTEVELEKLLNELKGYLLNRTINKN